MPGNPSANALNALMTSTQFGQQQQDRRTAQTREREAQGLANTQNKIAGALAPGGAGRQAGQQLASGSGNAQIMGDFANQIAGMDQAAREAATGRAEALGGLSITLARQPYEQRIQTLQSPQVQDFLRGSGFSPEQIASFDPTDANIQTQMGMLGDVQSALTQGLEAVTPAEQLSADTAARGQDLTEQRNIETGRHNLATEGIAQTAAQTAASRETRERLGAPSEDLETQFTQERQLRQEFTGITSDFRGIQNNINVIRTVSDLENAQGDLALVVAFTKLLDPGSVAREGEVQLTQSSASVVQQASNWATRLREGNTTLPPEVRQAFLEASEELAGAYERSFDLRSQEFGQIATDYGLNASRITVGGPGEGASPDSVQQFQEGQTATGPNGERAVFTNGEWRLN